MDYYPNIDAALFFTKTIFPKIRAIHTDAQFFIIGSRPVAAIQQLSSLPGITITGTVKDVRPFLSQCQVSVVPLRIAQGIQNKILEALACGLPVVSTPIAAGKLAFAKELPLAVAADPDIFAKHVLDYMANAPLSPDRVHICRQHLKKYYDWETNLSALDKIMEMLPRQI
jgi:glycosyltransferase involved in cell wall biosynthesis